MHPEAGSLIEEEMTFEELSSKLGGIQAEYNQRGKSSRRI